MKASRLRITTMGTKKIAMSWLLVAGCVSVTGCAGSTSGPEAQSTGRDAGPGGRPDSGTRGDSDAGKDAAQVVEDASTEDAGGEDSGARVADASVEDGGAEDAGVAEDAATAPGCPEPSLFAGALALGDTASVQDGIQGLSLTLRGTDVRGQVALVDYTNNLGTVTDLLMNAGEDYPDGTGFQMRVADVAAESVHLCLWRP